MKKKHLPTPTITDFEKMSKGFDENWNFPNCAGSLDG